MSKYISFILLLVLFCVRLEAQNDSLPSNTVENHYRIFISGGRGNLLVTGSSAVSMLEYMGIDNGLISSYSNSLKVGFAGGIDVYRMINRHWGYGIKYQYFNVMSSVAINTANSSMYYNTYTYNGNVRENLYMNYVGVGFSGGIFNDKKPGPGINYSFSVGPAFYRNERQFFTDYTLATKTTFGADFGLGLEYRFGRKLALGIRASLFYASLSDMNVTDGVQSVSVHLNNPELAARLNYVGYLSVDI